MNKKMTAILTSSMLLGTAILTSVSASNPFTDVKDGDWFSKDVEFVYEEKLMSGVSDSEFNPAGDTTRGMIVSVLWRLDGSPVETGKEFEDVTADKYYYNAVAWASNHGIVSGYSETLFGPDDPATREQLAAIVYRYAAYKGYDVSKEAELDKFADKDDISPYAVQNIKWANASGLISGTSETTISPKANVQRSQLAAILKRFCVNFVDANTATPAPTPTPTATAKPSGGGNGGGSAGGSVSTPTPTAKPTATPTPTAKPTATPTSKPTQKPVVQTGAAFTVETVEAKAGEEVTVAVDIANNPGVLGAKLEISYDDSMCTLVSVENGTAFADDLDFTKPGNLAANPLNFLWDAVEINPDDAKDGTVLYLTFKVNEDAEGECFVNLDVKDLVNNDVEDISSVATNGAIIISK